MIARPSGSSPKTAPPNRSNTFSCGSSSYIAISSRITARSESTSLSAGRNTMSAITSKARVRCSSITRAYREVVSLPVPALSSPPFASKIWSISSELYVSVPLNSKCSSRCESPAWSSVSPREPVPIHSPSATERTAGIASVTTRTPESSVVSRCVCATTSGAGPGPGRGHGRDRDPGHGRCADDHRDPRVVCEPQSDPSTLAVDLDHAHVDLVALIQDLFDRSDPLPGRDIGDVQQAVGALRELDECPELGRLDDLDTGELVADLNLFGHR